MDTVDVLEIGSSAIIDKITAPLDLKRRLLSLGFIKGNKVHLIAKSLGRETYVVRIGAKSQYALRHEEAKHILVTQES